MQVSSYRVNQLHERLCELALKFRGNWEGPLGKKDLSVKIANRTWENRLSGMKWGACGNVGQGGIRNPLHVPKGCMVW